MSRQYVPAQTFVTCDRCAVKLSVDTDPDAAWRPGWKPDSYSVDVDVRQYDLCPDCYRQLQTFMKRKS